jgi:hypothetical protein
MSFSTGYDGLCKEETLDAKSFFYNVTFDSYKINYNSSALSSCSNNVLFKVNPAAPDHIGSTHLSNSVCTNCDFNSMAYFDAPSPSQLGWFGGCGNILCTGRQNYIIEDHTNTLFPGGGVLLANS